MKPQDRAELNLYMVKLADGDRQAFDYIFETSLPIVQRFAHKMLSNPYEAEDVAQAALTKVFSKASDFRRDGDALSWILGITVFECKTARQKVKRRKEKITSEDDFNLSSDPASSVEDQLIQKNLEVAVYQVLDGLSESDRETIKTAIFQSERPDVAPATFRKRLARALERLRQDWRDQYE